MALDELEQMLASLERARKNSQEHTSNTNITTNADPHHELTNNTVTKSHALSRAYYRLSITEKRCMEALISKLNPQRTDNPSELELSAQEYAKTYNVHPNVAYRDISTATDALMHRVITIDRPNGKPGRYQLNIMDFADYRDDEGKIICSFTNSITPYLIQLSGKFSSYPLKMAVNFSSSYTWRFYELLVSWAQPKSETGGRFIGWINKQSVHELREMLGVPASYRWNMFESRVLDVVTIELREKAGIVVFIERIKTSRKITHLSIRFIEKEQHNSLSVTPH